MRLRRLSTALWLLVACRALARNLVLFTPTTQSDTTWLSDPDPAYNDLVPKLGPGDHIMFSNGKAFEIESKLGEGNTSYIFSVKGNPPRALRIPKSMSWFPRFMDTKGRRTLLIDGIGNPTLQKKWELAQDYNHMRTFIDVMMNGHRDLKEHGVEIVEVYDALPGEYLLVEQLPHDSFPLRSFLMQSEADEHFAELSQKLVAFARKTASFAIIGDFNDSQLLYDPEKKRWVLADWTDKHVPAAMTREKVFDEVFRRTEDRKLPKQTPVHREEIRQLELNINKAIVEARMAHSKEWFRAAAKNCFGRLFARPALP